MSLFSTSVAFRAALPFVCGALGLVIFTTWPEYHQHFCSVV